MQEMHAVPASDDKAGSANEKPEIEGHTQSPNVQPLRVENAISNDDRRLLALERKLENLEKTMRNDRKRLQRMIMMLALSDDNERELLDALKELNAADK